MIDESKPAVVLLSGGLDSATAAAIAREEGFAVHALTVDYGQRHRVEIEAARRIAASLGLHRHLVVRVELDRFGGSALTAAGEVPKDRSTEEIGRGIPVTYVPARNTVLLSLALAYAEAVDAADVFIGANVVDYSGYPDCRPEFIAAFEQLANLATKAAVEGRIRFRIRAPLSGLSKSQIIKRGTALGVDYSLTHSCYDPSPAGLSCGRCDSCLLRLKGFQEAGLTDPLAYQELE